MKSCVLKFFLLISVALFSQKKIIKKFEIKTDEIAISTLDLDDFVILNSDSNFIEITLFAENPNEQHIIFEEEYHVAKIRFKIPEQKPKEAVFRKFITKRLKRASAEIKVPKNVAISIFGDNINITSKNCKNSLSISIEKGIVKLNTIQKNVALKMYAGSVYATISKVNVKAISNIGNINIDEKTFEKSYQKNDLKLRYSLTINTIKAILFLTTQ